MSETVSTVNIIESPHRIAIYVGSGLEVSALTAVPQPNGGLHHHEWMNVLARAGVIVNHHELFAEEWPWDEMPQWWDTVWDYLERLNRLRQEQITLTTKKAELLKLAREGRLSE